MKRISLIVILSIILASCATKVIEVPVNHIRTEIEFLDRVYRDSIHIHDSIFVKHKNDTVFLEKYKTLYKEKIVKDSIYIKDSIKVDVPIIVEVEKDISIFQKLKYALMTILVLLGLFALYRILIIFKK